MPSVPSSSMPMSAEPKPRPRWGILLGAACAFGLAAGLWAADYLEQPPLVAPLPAVTDVGPPALGEQGGLLLTPSGDGHTDVQRVSDTRVASLSDSEYHLEQAALVRRTLELIEESYFAIDSLSPAALFEAGLQGMADGTHDVLWTPGQGDIPGALQIGRRVLLLETSSLTRFDEVADSLARVYSFYLEARALPADELEVEFATIRGLLRLADRPTVLLVDARLDSFKIRSRGALSGIGCTIGNREGLLTVLRVIEESPSALVGLRQGDRIVRVDGESTINMSVTEAVSRIRGMRGTWVILDVQRDGESTPLRLRIMRDRIKIENVESVMLPDQVGYVRITNFNDETLSNFRVRLDRIAPGGSGLRGLILDLRNNGGGSLKQSAFMVDEFLADGLIVRTEGRSEQSVRGLVREISARPPQLRPDMPLVVLVDHQTASGSEILAGALRYHQRAVLIGQRTYGKGSVQKEYPLHARASFKMTLARYLVAGVEYLQDVGLEPDITLIPVEVSAERIHFRYPELESAEDEADDHDDRASSTPAHRGHPQSRVYYLEKSPPVSESVSNPERLLEDFQLRFATELLGQVRGPAREDVLREAQSFVTRTRTEQGEVLEKALAARGLDWSAPGVPPSGAQLDALLKTSSEPQGATPGQPLTLSLEVTNRSAQPLFRVRGLSQAADRLFDGLEFFYGRLGPGETRRWDHTLSVPEGTAPGVRSVSFQLTSSAPSTTTYDTGVAVAEAPSPNLELELAYRDLAPGTPGHENRRVEPGEEVLLQVLARNTGKGATGPLSVSLQSPLRRELELRDARASLEPILPGEQREVTLSFQLMPQADVRVDGMLSLTLEVTDRAYLQRVEKALSFENPWTGRVKVVPPRIQLDSSVPMASLREAQVPLTGRVFGAQGVRHLTVFRGRHKVVRQLPGSEGGRGAIPYEFQVTVPLEQGANRVEVRAEDEVGLTTRRLIWFRTESG